MDVQRIPMAWYMPGMKHSVNNAKIRLVDIMPTILKTMGIKADRAHGRDGVFAEAPEVIAKASA